MQVQEAKARTRVPQCIRMPDLETVSTKVGDGYMCAASSGHHLALFTLFKLIFDEGPALSCSCSV